MTRTIIYFFVTTYIGINPSLSVIGIKAWRAIPTHKAFNHRRHMGGLDLVTDETVVSDEYLPRTSLHSTFKFGVCRPDAVAPVYLRRKASIHFPTQKSTRADFIYLLEFANTQRFKMQCVVLKIMVPLKYLFRRSRLPMYYCQGLVLILMFNDVTRLELHEFFLHHHLNIPADFHFEFYHPAVDWPVPPRVYVHPRVEG